MTISILRFMPGRFAQQTLAMAALGMLGIMTSSPSITMPKDSVSFWEP